MIYESKEFTLKNGLNILLKTPEPSDARMLLDFIIRLTGQTPLLLSSPEDMAAFTEEKERAFIESYATGKNCFIGVYVNGEIVGDCDISFNTHLKDRHRCSVGIGIDEKYCGMGIGSLLFDEMIRLAKETEGTEQMELGVINGNDRAVALYKKKGFEQTGIIPRAVRQKDGTYADEILMTKLL